MLKLSRPVILASGSPRRRELLTQIVEDFTIEVSNIDEELHTTDDPVETAEKLAFEKASAVGRDRPRSPAWIIGADTVVAFQSPIGWVQLAKPASAEEAVQMLTMLSGRTHQVTTGVAIIDPLHSVSFSVTTLVTFRELEFAEIRDYVATGEPMDKAGAYAIQGGAANFVASVEGSVTNVIGLPIDELIAALQSLES